MDGPRLWRGHVRLRYIEAGVVGMAPGTAGAKERAACTFVHISICMALPASLTGAACREVNAGTEVSGAGALGHHAHTCTSSALASPGQGAKEPCCLVEATATTPVCSVLCVQHPGGAWGSIQLLQYKLPAGVVHGSTRLCHGPQGSRAGGSRSGSLTRGACRGLSGPVGACLYDMDLPRLDSSTVYYHE